MTCGGIKKLIRLFLVIFLLSFVFIPAAKSSTIIPKFYGFFIESSLPLEKNNLLSSLPDDLRKLVWDLAPVEMVGHGRDRYTYQLLLRQPVTTHSTRRFWNASHDMKKFSKIQFFDPIFVPEILPTQRSERSSYSLLLSLFQTIDDLTGIKNQRPPGLFNLLCSWPLKERSRYKLHGQNYCYPKSSDSFEWVDQKFLHFKKAHKTFSVQGEDVVIGHPDVGYWHHPEIIDSILVDKSYDISDNENDGISSLSGRFFGHGVTTASGMVALPGRQDYKPYTQEHLATYGENFADAPYAEGVAPKSRIIPYNISQGKVILFTYLNLTKAIERGVQDGVGVLSISLGGFYPIPWLKRAVEKADREGIIVVAAAGNYLSLIGLDHFIVWPARYPSVIAVAASDSDGKFWRHSSRGQAVDITAPGVGVWAATINKKETTIYTTVTRTSGTSLATSFVSGAAALFLSHHGRDHLISLYGKSNMGKLFLYMLHHYGYTRPKNWNEKDYGPGILDVYNLLKAPLPPAHLFVPKKQFQSRSLENFTELAHLGEMFPKLKDPLVRAAFRRAFGFPSDEKLEQALALVGDELTFYLAQYPQWLNRVEELGIRAFPKNLKASKKFQTLFNL